MATQATPGNNHQQVPPANHPPAPIAPAQADPDGDEEIDSNDEEVEQLRAQVTTMTTEMEELRGLIDRMAAA